MEYISRAGLCSSSLTVDIRDFVIEDYVAVARLWKDCGFEERPGDSLSGIKMKLERDPDLFLVAKEGAKVLGAVIGAWDGRRGWIYHIAVDPGSRRKKLGSALVREVERRMRKKGALRVHALIMKWNAPSLCMFQTLGYDCQDDLVVVGKALE